MSRIIENNNVVVSGEIISEFEYSHEMFGERFYMTKLSVERISHVVDMISIMVSDRTVDVSENWTGQHVKVEGQIRTYNKHDGNRNRLIISIFSEVFEVLENCGKSNINYVSLSGYICKLPSYRETPLGRNIADLLLAVNRPYGKSDYIPCICWGRNAVFASGLNIGTHIKVEGRLQSREYIKRFEDGTQETKTAYEVSIYKMEVVEETED